MFLQAIEYKRLISETCVAKTNHLQGWDWIVDKLLSAQEIADLGLPGVPGTKTAVHSMAKREGWRYEEVTGVGGRRRVYELPERYRQGLAAGDSGRVVGAITPTGKADARLLALVIRTLDEFVADRRLALQPDKKAAIIALLYDYVQKGADEDDIQSFLKVIG